MDYNFNCIFGVLEREDEYLDTIRQSEMYRTGMKYINEVFKKQNNVRKVQSNRLKHEFCNYIYDKYKVHYYIDSDAFILLMYDLGFTSKKMSMGSTYYFHFDYIPFECECGGSYKYKLFGKSKHCSTLKHIKHLKKTSLNK